VTRAGLVMIALTFLAGLWLVAAPFALRYQHPHAAWTGITRADVGIGSALAVTGLGGMLAVIAGRVREMYADAAVATTREDERNIPPVPPGARPTERQ
jgi:cytochrome bd-type quinol oxidase subunit 2